MQNSSDQQYWIYAILILGVIECLLLIFIGLEPAPTNATGHAHPSIPSMVVGGDSARFDAIASYGFWFQIFVLAQAHCLAALGVKSSRRSASFLLLLAACYLLAVFVWWQMFSGYQEFVATGNTEYFFGFPSATAWQTYGTWFSGFGLIALYSFGFSHYVWSSDDQSTFEALVAKTVSAESVPDSSSESTGA